MARSKSGVRRTSPLRNKRRGLQPPDNTEKYSIFVDPLKVKVKPHEDAVEAAPERNELLEHITFMREKIRRTYRTNLFTFCRDVLGYDKMEEEVHGELCRRLMDAYHGRGKFRTDEGSIRRYLFLLPRGTFKTTIATIGYPLWILTLNDPPAIGALATPGWAPDPSFNGRKGYDQRILIGSEVDDHATKFHQNIKDHLVGTEAIRDFFGALAPEKRIEGLWTKRQSNVTWRMDFRHKEANITTTSLDATVNSGHYDIGIFDDMISEKQVTNDEQITQTIEWYRRLMPLMEKPSIVIFIGTRWHDKDLYGHFLDEEKDKWEVYRESAERSDAEVKAGKRRYFFPSLLGPEVLEDIRTTMRPYLFSCQYYNDPIAATDAMFKKDYFENAYFNLPAGDHLKKFLDNKTIITTIDPATSKEKTACHRVVTTWAWDHRGIGWCLDLYREREVNPAEWMEEAFRQYETWRPLQIGIEQLDTFQFGLDQISQERGVWPPWFELKPSKRKKELRIAGLEPLARSGRLRLQRHKHEAFEEEALRFPRGRYKDALDATAYQLDLAFSGMVPQVEPPEEGTPEFMDAMIKEVHQKRLERLKIGSYSGAGPDDWYNM